MKKMIDRVKLFDFFASKHSNVFYVFPRTHDHSAFGLNIVSDDRNGLKREFCLYDASKDPSLVIPADFNCRYLLDTIFDFETMCYIKFTLKTMPKPLKEAVIDKCIENNGEIFFNEICKTRFIPAARSLEELAIKMELES